MLDELKRLKKAVREKCLECSGGTPAEVALCDIDDCPLFPFRMELWPSLFDAGSENGPSEPESGRNNGETTNDAEYPAQLRLF